MMRIGIAADHGGFALKKELTESLRGSGCEVVDFGAYQLTRGAVLNPLEPASALA